MINPAKRLPPYQLYHERFAQYQFISGLIFWDLRFEKIVSKRRSLALSYDKDSES